MESFGDLLRAARRRCWDPLRAGWLTQERLGELLGGELGDAGYSGAAVSDWERGKSKIHADNRPVLVALVAVLLANGGLKSAAEANRLLRAGNYRGLDAAEELSIFGTAAVTRTAAVEPDQVARSPAIRGEAERRKQQILLDKVANFWIKGVLEHKAAARPPLELTWEYLSGAVARPWQELLGPTIHAARPPVDGDVLAAFRAAGNALLILGRPGSGKTTVLLRLADALAKEAAADPLQPIPVVLNLVSWSERRGEIRTWLVEEMVAKYQVPRQTGRRWLDDDALTLLLDGFDELPANLQRPCALALNRFRDRRGLSGIVVASRLAEYEACGVQLKLGEAISIRPLSPTQIDGFARAALPEATQLAAALQADGALQELAQTPLMLQVIGVAHASLSEDLSLAAKGSSPLPALDATRRLLLDAYVRRMFERRRPAERHSPEQTAKWLAWLARGMLANQESVFLLEQLQPSWLPAGRWRHVHLVMSGALGGVVGGLIMWLVWMILNQIIPELEAVISGPVAVVTHLPQLLAEPLVLIVGNALLGVGMALIHGRFYERAERRAYDGLAQKEYHRPTVVVGLAIGLLTVLALIAFGPLLLAIGWGVAEAVMFMIASRGAFGGSYRSDIGLVEALAWSWPAAARGVAAGIALALVAEAVETSLFPPYNHPWRMITTFALGGLLLGGLQGQRLEAGSRPNQGIWLSARNAATAAIIAAVPFGLLSRLYRDNTTACMSALLIALVAVTLFGGGNVGKHYLLRLLLAARGDFPWRAVPFLEAAARLTFLRKVGGGYIFLHRLLQEHFAAVAAAGEIDAERTAAHDGLAAAGAV